MSTKKEVYAHNQLTLRSDRIDLLGTTYVNGENQSPSYVWIQLAGMKDGTSATGFLLTSSLKASALAAGQWARLGLNAADGFFNDNGTAAYTAKKITSDITFNATTGQLTFQSPGFYTIIYNVIVARTSGPPSRDHLFVAAIGGNGNPPNESFGGGGGNVLNNATNCAGTCITEVTAPGETRSIFVFHDELGGATATDVDVYALNLVFEKKLF
jgi:hypothetical protein